MSKDKAPAEPAEAAAIVTVKKTPLQLRVDAATDTIEQALAQCSISVIRDLAPIQATVQMAAGIKSLRAALTKDVVDELFMPLVGSKLGFRTDKDSGTNGPPYEWTVIRDVAIDAMIHGAYLVGNEVNVIAYGSYYTKEFYTRKVLEWPGLTDLRPSPGLPQMNSAGDGMAVPMVVTWKLNGRAEELSCTIAKDADGATVIDRRIAVKLNKGQGADAAIGKARRKAMYMVYERLQGNRFMPEDGDALDTTGHAVGEFAAAVPASAGAQPAAGTEKGMDALLNRVKPAGAGATAGTAPAAPPKEEKPMTEAEKLAAEVAENDRLEREAIEKENAK
jgi:hypothetical protein